MNKTYGYLYLNHNTGRFCIMLKDGREYGYLRVGQAFEIFWNGQWISSRLVYDDIYDVFYFEGFLNYDLPQGVLIRL